jgi:hypothetical protein
MMDMDLIIPGELVQEGEDFMVDTFINQLVNERSRDVAFRTSLIDIVEAINANVFSDLLFINTDMIGYIRNIDDWVDKIGVAKFINFYFVGEGFYKVDTSLFLLNECCIWKWVDVVFHTMGF